MGTCAAPRPTARRGRVECGLGWRFLLPLFPHRVWFVANAYSVPRSWPRPLFFDASRFLSRLLSLVLSLSLSGCLTKMCNMVVHTHR